VPTVSFNRTDPKSSIRRSTGLYKFIPENRAHYNYTKIAIVSDRDDVQKNAKTYFEKYVFKQSEYVPIIPSPMDPPLTFDGWTVETFKDR
jgi:hypothetical protein